MPEWTGQEIEEARSLLEERAALSIGRFILEFCKLEMELGLDLAWKNGGIHLDSVTAQLSASTFGARLERLRSWVTSVSNEHPIAGQEYLAWLESAEKLRDVRNQFIHGRWGFRPTESLVSNVVGLPTSPSQREVLYDPEELDNQARKVASLRLELSGIRLRWPML